MNYITPPTHDDSTTLNSLRDKGYSDNANELALIEEAYHQYTAANGRTNALAPIILPQEFRDKFKKLYDNPRLGMEYISVLRSTEEIDSCPMCGSPLIGTLDHIFPRHQFAEFAIFSKNLVPACHGCNTKRGDAYIGIGDERILHPYFDEWLAQRLVYSELIPTNGNYDRPTLNICLVDPAHLEHAQINFHITAVIRKTSIFTKQIQIWTKLKRRPRTYLRYHGGPINDLELIDYLTETLQNADYEANGLNNWKSMIFFGILQNRNCRDFLIRHWRQLGIAI